MEDSAAAGGDGFFNFASEESDHLSTQILSTLSENKKWITEIESSDDTRCEDRGSVAGWRCIMCLSCTGKMYRDSRNVKSWGFRLREGKSRCCVLRPVCKIRNGADILTNLPACPLAHASVVALSVGLHLYKKQHEDIRMDIAALSRDAA